MDDEYEHIITYLERIGISDSKRQAELADHLAVVTELHMNSGQDFDTAFSQAKLELSENDVLEIDQHAASFKGYPRFLGKPFLIGLAVVTLGLFFTGLLMRYNHWHHPHLLIVIGRRGFTFVLLPMLLLYNLTEYANKTKQVLKFILQFSICQLVADFLVRHKLNISFLVTSIVIGALWMAMFWLAPLLQSKIKK